MSPLTPRLARPLMRFFSSARNLVREPHPLPGASRIYLPHQHDNLALISRVAGTAGWYFLGLTTVLGWPLAAKAVLLRTGV
ncbi:hypothetical protein LTS18_004280 [Coniosporium uncinatum]|uniref:Uncharacterized protein n=1 Tax=Coniosporium uncinatum TaxID=93489 RepID=A0ACC3E082_9PEZI|nr:hypothetical protein LTS18_004280 [Coniosporium uncinatum]